MVFDRDKPSCYSNGLFSELMEGSEGHFVLAGFAGETACLSTAIDAYQMCIRDRHITIIELQRRHRAFWIDCEQVLAVAGILGREFNLGQIEFGTGFEQDDVG